MTDLSRLESIRDRIRYGIPAADIIGDMRFLLSKLEACYWELGQFGAKATEPFRQACEVGHQRLRCRTCAGSGEDEVTTGVLGRCGDCGGSGVASVAEHLL